VVTNHFSDPAAARALLQIDRKLRHGQISAEKAKREAEKIASGSSALFTEQGLSKSTRAMIWATLVGPILATGLQIGANYLTASRSTDGQSPPNIEVTINGDNNTVSIDLGELTVSTEGNQVDAETATSPDPSREDTQLTFGDDVPSMEGVDWYFFLFDRFGIIAPRFSLPPAPR
jgi:hypothetical protein